MIIDVNKEFIIHGPIKAYFNDFCCWHYANI